MVDSSEEDIERIASRLAMVVSEDGEAANAGRAIGQLARRLGLTGGDLKQIFMAGAASNDHAARLTQSAGAVERQERELNTLRSSLRLAESEARLMERERDALQYEIAALRMTLDRRHSGMRLRRVVTWAVVVALLVAGAVGYMNPTGQLVQEVARMTLPGDRLPTDAGATARVVPGAPVPGAFSPGGAMPGTAARRDPNAVPAVGALGTGRVGVVHVARAAVFEQPDRAAPVLATLRAGMPIVIHRLLWNMLVQWAEIDVGSSTGYVLTTDIDLS